MINETNKFKNKNTFKKYIGINLRIKNKFFPQKLTTKKQKYIPNLNSSSRFFIDFYKNINSYIGLRHKNNLPTRGQRTKTNAKTRKKRKSK